MHFMAFAVAGFTAACAGGSDGDPPVEPEPEQAAVELGSGEAEFEPMEGEPTIEMAAGFQGGFHIWTSFLASRFEGERLDMVLVTELDGVADSDLTMRATLKGSEVTNDAGDVFWTFAGYPGQVRDARCAHGKRVHLSVTLNDESGNEASDDRYCYVSLDEEYRDDTCE
jgi:hypothetical protein